MSATTSSTCSNPCAPLSPRRARRFVTRSAIRSVSTVRRLCARSSALRSIPALAPKRSASPTLCDSPTRFAPTSPAPTMPELPEVESLRRILARTAVGRTIGKVRIGEARLRRRITANFGPAVAGRRIVKLSRRAKYLIVELDGDDVILVHLGMSGSLTHRHDGFDAGEFNPRHDHLEFALDDGSRLVYNDPRRFGMVRLIPRAALASTAELKS